MKIALVLGTARENNQSSKVFDVVKSSLEEGGVEVVTVNVSDHLFGKTTTADSDLVHPWRDTVESVDGAIFVTPEYNHSYPGELKILIDTLYGEYTGKVAGIVSVSNGPYGGVRVNELLKLLLLTVNFTVVNKSVNIANIDSDLDIEKVKKHTIGMIEEMKKHV